MIVRTGKNTYLGTAAGLEALCDWVKAYLIDTHGPVLGVQKYLKLSVPEAVTLWEQHGDGRRSDSL